MSTASETSGRTRAPSAASASKRATIAALGRFPRQADADVDRLHLAARRFFGEQHRAVETAGEQDGGRHGELGNWVIW